MPIFLRVRIFSKNIQILKTFRIVHQFHQLEGKFNELIEKRVGSMRSEKVENCVILSDFYAVA